MRLDLEADDLRPLIETVVAEVVATVTSAGLADNRLAYTEPQAAGLLGITAVQLRDTRLRGEIISTKVGARIGYEKSELIKYLARQRTE